MSLMQVDLINRRPCTEERTKPDASITANTPCPVANNASTLTFITSDGEAIVFDGMDTPIEEAAALAGEDALGKIWNRPAEDMAWQDT